MQDETKQCPEPGCSGTVTWKVHSRNSSNGAPVCYRSLIDCPICTKRHAFNAVFGGIHPNPSQKDDALFEAQRAAKCQQLEHSGNAAALGIQRDIEAGTPWSTLVLYGPTGRGKTTAAMKVLFGEIAQRNQCKFTTEFAIATAFGYSKGGFDASTREGHWGSQHIDQCRDAQVLCIDEVGLKTELTQNSLDFLIGVINRNQDQGRKLIVTSNMLADWESESYRRACAQQQVDRLPTLRERLGERAWSRIADGKGKHVIETFCPNWRRVHT